MIDEVLNLIKNNQILFATLGISGAGIITFWVKDLPSHVGKLIMRELTTTLTITSQHAAFHYILKWLAQNYKQKNFRHFKLTNGRWGDDATTTLTIGYGVHVIRFLNTWFFINFYKTENQQSYHEIETIILTRLGRKKEAFIKFIDHATRNTGDMHKLKVFKYTTEWGFVGEQHKRNINTVFLEKEKKEKVINLLESFINNENWYRERDIPYHLGVLLYGPPGTGKTSLIKAIASKLNYPLYVIPTTSMIHIADALEKIPDRCVVVIEDIDCNIITRSRELKQNNTTLSNQEQTVGDLATALNALDGINCKDGRVLIATTNYRERLDSAILRPGRFDEQIHMGFVTYETFREFINLYYPGTVTSNINLKKDITFAYLQNLVLQRLNINQIMDLIKE